MWRANIKRRPPPDAVLVREIGRVARLGRKVFGASGAGSRKGLVPDPGSVAGTTAFLCEDATWAVPSASVADGDKGDITVSGGGATWTIDAGVVTLAKLADLAQQRLIGRNTASTGVPEAVTAAQVLDWLGTTRGAILFRGAAAWSILAPNTAGYVLTDGGVGADPAWAAPGGGGGGLTTAQAGARVLLGV